MSSDQSLVEPDRYADCGSCGKTCSPNQQMIDCDGRILCAVSVAHLVESGDLDPDARVNVSADYIHRLLSGIVRFDWPSDA